MNTHALYYSNEQADRDNRELIDDVRLAIASGRSIVIYGPPGTGKTTDAMYYALSGRESFRWQCKAGDTAYDLLGDRGIRDGCTVFDPGVGAHVVRVGARLCVDEVNYASEDLKALLYSLGDGKPFTLSDGTVITPAPGLQVILTTNEPPADYFPIGSGIADRFPFLHYPEPSPEALDSVHPMFREICRRSVRSGATGLRAWQHFAGMLADRGYAPESLLDGLSGSGDPILSDPNGIVLPSVDTRERTIHRIGRSVFGENAPEIIRAFRVATANDGNVTASRPVARTAADRYALEAYERGRRDGLAEGLAETIHAHEYGDCSDCENMFDSGYASGREDGERYAEHDHEPYDDCSACTRLFERGVESCECEHDHDSDHDGTCYSCDSVWETGRDAALEALGNVASLVLSDEDSEALISLVTDEDGMA
jgi:hypothetical protein